MNKIFTLKDLISINKEQVDKLYQIEHKINSIEHFLHCVNSNDFKRQNHLFLKYWSDFADRKETQYIDLPFSSSEEKQFVLNLIDFFKTRLDNLLKEKYELENMEINK